MPKLRGGDDNDDDRASILLLSMGNLSSPSKMTTGLRTDAEKANGVADAGGGGGRPKRSTHTPELQKSFHLNEGPATKNDSSSDLKRERSSPGSARGITKKGISRRGWSSSSSFVLEDDGLLWPPPPPPTATSPRLSPYSRSNGSSPPGSPKSYSAAKVLCPAAKLEAENAQALGEESITQGGVENGNDTLSSTTSSTTTGVQTVPKGASIAGQGSQYRRLRIGRNSINGRYKCGICGQLKVNHVCGKVYTESVSSQTVDASAGERVTLADGPQTVSVRVNYFCQALNHHSNEIGGNIASYDGVNNLHDPSSSNSIPRGSFHDLLSAANSMAQDLGPPSAASATHTDFNSSNGSNSSSNTTKSITPDSLATMSAHSSAQATTVAPQEAEGGSLPSEIVVRTTALSLLPVPTTETTTAEPTSSGGFTVPIAATISITTSATTSDGSSSQGAASKQPSDSATSTTVQQHWQLAESKLLELVNSLPLKDVPLPPSVTPKDLHALAFQAAVLTLCGVDSKHAFAQAASAATLSNGASPIPPLMGFPLHTGENVPPNFARAGIANSSSSFSSTSSSSSISESGLASRLRSRSATGTCNSA